MTGVNKVILVGRVGKDVQVKENQFGKMAFTSIATSEKYTDRNGDKKEVTEWHNLMFSARLAEVAEEYIKKGDMIYVEGKIFTKKWETESGEQRQATQIKVLNLQMLSGKHDSEKEEKPVQTKKATNVIDYTFEDDIPF